MIKVDGPVILAFLLAMVRAGAWLKVAPPFTSIPMPMMVRASLAAGLALIAVPYVPSSQVPESLAGMIGAIVMQVVIGSLMGMVTLMLLTAIETAGSLIDMFGGIVLPPALDPLSQNQVPLVGTMYYVLAVALLFASGGYEFLVAGWVQSFSGAGISLSSLGPISSTLIGDLSTLFVGALEVAAPVIVVLFLSQIIMGMIAKAAPQANIFLLAFPYQIGITLLLVGLGIELLPVAVTNIVQRAVHDALVVAGL